MNASYSWNFRNLSKKLLRDGLSVLLFTLRLFTFSTDRMRNYDFCDGEVLDYGLQKSFWEFFVLI